MGTSYNIKGTRDNVMRRKPNETCEGKSAYIINVAKIDITKAYSYGVIITDICVDKKNSSLTRIKYYY